MSLPTATIPGQPAGPAPEPAPDRPALRTGLDVTPPSAGQPYATIYDPAGDRYCRVRAREYAVLALFDGSRTLLELETELADRYPPSWVAGFVRTADQHGLLAGAAPPVPVATRPSSGPRVEVVRPTLVRLVWDRPDRLFAAVDPLRRVGASRWGLVALAAAALWGLVSFVVQAPAQVAALSSMGPATALVLAASVVASMAAHELAHGLVLRHLGGRVRGVGVMLLYFVPAAFCDVTDAWRLPSRAQRAAVAVAGPACNLVLAGLVAVPLAVAGPGSPRDLLALVLTVNVGMAVLNLVPLVRFDGYWLLVALTDVPNLMDRSRAAARQLLHGRAPGAGVALALYGLATYAAPPAVVAVAATGYRDLLLGLGGAGSATWLAAVGVAAAVAPALVRRQGRALRWAVVVGTAAVGILDLAAEDVSVVDWLVLEALHGL